MTLQVNPFLDEEAEDEDDDLEEEGMNLQLDTADLQLKLVS